MTCGENGEGMLTWPSSTPLLVTVKSTSPMTSGDPVARLWGNTSSSPIMSYDQMMSPSVGPSPGSPVNGPSLPSASPSASRHTTCASFETYHTRSPSTNAVEQTPCSGQSLTRPADSLSCTICQTNSPVAASNAITTPLSPW